MKEYKTIAEIAEEFKVTYESVRLWIKKGLTFKTEKIVGFKPRKVLRSEDVKKFLNAGVK